MTPEEIDKKVAEALGWKTYQHVYKDNDYYRLESDHIVIEYVKNWHPSTNLTQAVDHIVPVLELNECWYHLIDELMYYDHPQTRDSDCGSLSGQGSTTSERMAHALCQVFLTVKEIK